MKQSIKKTTAKLLTLMMLIALIPNMAFATDTWDSITDSGTGITVSVSSGYESLNIDPSGSNYAITSTINGYFPQHFSLKISDTSATVTGTNGASFSFFNGEYGVVTMGSSAAVLTITNGNGSFTISLPEPNGGSTSGDGIHAFLPAPGQFTNEGLANGGWGGIYVSGLSGTKNMVNNVAQTGVSLGFFGGYVVLDYGTNGISNSASNPYGVDFILYGNAFKGNSEPGCVQVSQDGNTWYDIAGSLYYDKDTVRDYSLTYTNPVAGDDNTTSNYGTEGTISTGGVPYTGSKAGTITYNTWHQHSWFPLYANYFKAVNGNPALAKTADLDFASYNYDINNGSTLTLSGVMLGDATNTTTSKYKFGYCDVHPNGSANSTAYNPYTATDNSTGGDPIDISWAVDSNGEPVELSSIRYIRVYTGAAAMNGIFGEISTEISGSYAVTGTGDGEASETFDIYDPNNGVYIDYDYMHVTEVEANGSIDLEIDSNAQFVSLNGQLIDTSSTYTLSESIGSGQVKYYQLIAQSGTESPFITVLKVIGQ